MKKETLNWIASSEYDLNTAEHMLKSGRYLYVIFVCHLSIEKLLKAIISEDTGKLPPKAHDLIYLASLAKLQPPESNLDFIGKINSASVVTRYPEDLSMAVSAYPKEIAEDYLARTKEALSWLKQDTRLKK
ncbi:MAG: HEPN domain-containing protein [Thermodesulfovibrionales bacterium]|nr:HEPN domain-containing protein [Thermodesulfovibrionales bacterium]